MLFGPRVLPKLTSSAHKWFRKAIGAVLANHSHRHPADFLNHKKTSTQTHTHTHAHPFKQRAFQLGARRQHSHAHTNVPIFKQFVSKFAFALGTCHPIKIDSKRTRSYKNAYTNNRVARGWRERGRRPNEFTRPQIIYNEFNELTPFVRLMIR